ncbi:bifunctional folylpolyglutamate synthase/dihydrofolate synthase [Novispirillum sp. DQ9]|uniref:bifunctional folylpolyglutamate synthase/dihydrofolate synthase n=1 Tax=Novispirillum sp. DQ9 TaxID=3398612 RepID=UPI003C7BF293
MTVDAAPPPASRSGREPDAILERLLGLHPKVIDLSLDRVLRLLGELGNPQDALPPVIHVAGTNGKGSVIAFLRAFLEAAGLRVHVYTSPHLVRFNERIRLAGEIISDAALSDLLEEVERVNDGKPITFFEVTTCAAFLAFSRVPADVVLLETGLGGRLDATNVVRRPAMTVLTPIGMDHEQYLGGRIEAIAAEKAHILKPASPCVFAKQERKVAQIIELRSLEVGAPTFAEGKEWHVRVQPAKDGTGEGEVVYQGRDVTWTLPTPALAGAHQVRNAGLALAAIEHLKGFTIPEAALAKGMRTVQWPARMQRLTRGPLVDLLPEGWELWLDGAHNPHAGKMLATFLRGWKDKPLDVVIGMMGPKDAGAFFGHIAAKVHRLRAVPVPGEPNAKPPEEVAEAARAQGIGDVAVTGSLETALKDLIANANRPQRVLIVGSLYLAGSVLAENG